MTFPEWLKPGAWGAAIGAGGVLILAFSAGWIVTAGDARTQAEAQSDKAVLAALTPVCVAQFRELSDSSAQIHLAALADESSWQQGDYVEAQGWATLPGSESPNGDVADACADRLLELAAG
jgi:hypothetical protein